MPILPKGFTPLTSDRLASFGSSFSMQRGLWIAFFSGIGMGLAPAPAYLWGLAWLALIPLWILAIDKARSPRQAIAYGMAWGIGYHGLALSWVRDLHPLTWMGVPWLASVAITLFCWVFITLWGAAIAGVWAGGMNWLFYKKPLAQSGILRILVGTALWCSLETLWSQGFLYWTSLSLTQSPHNSVILHLGQLSGAQGVTAAIVSVNGAFAAVWLHNQNKQSQNKQSQNKQSQNKQSHLTNYGLPLCYCLLLHGMGFGLYSQPIANLPTTALKVGIIQGNVPTRIKLFSQGEKLALERYTLGYEKLAAEGVEAVLTPEGTFPWLWVNQPSQARNPLYQEILARGVTAWIGTVGTRQERITQTLFTIAGSGEVISRYDKVKLVPLGEYVPFESVLGSVIGRLSPIDASMQPGRTDQVFDTPFGRAIVGICYESAFPQLFRDQAARGGQFILTASNNDPYNATMMAQHHAQDVMRSIETDRWAVRATNTGFSGIVSPHGNTEWLSGFRTYETHAHTIYRRQTQTLYVRWGDWLTPLLAIGAIGGWVLVWMTQPARSRVERDR